MSNVSERRMARAAQAPVPSPGPHVTLGTAPGATRIDSARGDKRPLLQGSSVLPELQQAETKIRAWWKHPAFLVSMILSILALLAMAAFMIVPLFFDDDVVVSDLHATEGENTLHLQWSGPDVEYAVFSVAGDGTVLDITQTVAGTHAWIPNAAGLFDQDTCFVVRDAELDAEVTLNAEQLQEQGAQSVCVADAQ